MKQSNFYPSYIPGKWIHYTHHKKRRIRKKYLNRITHTVYQHDPDMETQCYKLRTSMSRCGMTTSNLTDSLLFGGLTGLIEGTAFGGIKPMTALPNFYSEDPVVEIPDDVQKLNDALTELATAIRAVIEPIMAAVKKVIDKLFKWAGDFWDHIWCNNRHWWTVAEHHRKYRIRKKYRNKIKRAARQKASELLPYFQSDNNSPEEPNEASDDEEGP